ncbi:hypothetical protein ACOB87_16070 [Streptomyces sp. YS-B37]|uniref:hypothetical protein n=1 Tax=Streptomyces sp. YS-B37 TaxID=3407669 RepID=UPI003B5002BB
MMKHRFPTLLFVAVCGLAPAVLGNLLHWPALLWGFMTMVTASGSLLLVMTVLSRGRATPDPYEPGEPEPPAAPPYQETQLVDAPLSSAADGYEFLFSATVWWRPAPDHAHLSDSACSTLAVSSVASRALEVVHREVPGRVNFARYLLEGELGVPLQDRSGQVTAFAADVTLSLTPADRERLQKLSDLRKDEEVWEYERQHERNKRRYLGDDVLKSAGSAVVWWLARHEDEIEKAVDMIGPLAQIAAAANDEKVPELFRHLLVPSRYARSEPTPENPLWEGPGQGDVTYDREEEVGVSDRLRLLLDAVGLKPGMDGYTVFVHRVVRNLEAEGLTKAADEIRRTLLAMPDEDDDEEPSSGSPDPDADAGKFAPESGADERERTWEEASGEDPTPPYFWDTSHNPHRPTESGAQDEDGS